MGTAILLKAINFAARKHRFQNRKGMDNIPYINHCIQVADSLANIGNEKDTSTLIAAVLHDTLEDTQTELHEIEELFGKEVSDIDTEITDDMSMTPEERKEIQLSQIEKLSVKAKKIRIADKACNIKDISRPGLKWTKDRKLDYLKYSKDLIDKIRGTNEFLEQEFDRQFEKAIKIIESKK